MPESDTWQQNARTVLVRRSSSGPRFRASRSLDLGQPENLRPSGHEFTHPAADRLEVVGLPVRLDGRLVRVTLEKHVGVLGFGTVERVELTAGLVRSDLRDELLRDRF